MPPTHNTTTAILVTSLGNFISTPSASNFTKLVDAMVTHQQNERG